MQFTFRCPDNVFKAIQQLADRHGVKVGTVINGLVRRGLVSGHFVPFAIAPDRQDLKALIKELNASSEGGREMIHDLMGVDIEKMSINELVALAMGEALPLAIAERYYPGVPIPEEWENPLDLFQQLEALANEELEEALAALPGDGELEQALAELED
jgi:hypothetical protein